MSISSPWEDNLSLQFVEEIMGTFYETELCIKAFYLAHTLELLDFGANVTSHSLRERCFS